MAQTLLRPIHKAELQRIIQTISFESANLVCNIGYETSGLTDPYIFIVSQGLNPNVEGGITLDNQTYYRGYEYMLVVAFQLASTGLIDLAQEARIDKLEELVLNQFQDDDVRNNNTNWRDVIVKDISTTFNPDPNLTDNLLYKTYTIEIRNFISMSDLP